MKAFPKIYTFGDAHVRHILDGDVVVVEKIDGSQWGFGIVDGKPFYRSKGRQVYREVADKMFYPALETSERILSSLNQDIQFYAETLHRPKHNLLAYERVPLNNLYLFAVQVDGEFLPISDVHSWATKLEIEPPNILFQGKLKDSSHARSFLTTSCLGGVQMEGVVITNYNAPTVVKGWVVNTITTAKVVTERFKERHGKKSSKQTVQSFIESFRTEARWHKAVQHLKESGVLQEALQDIGPAMKEIALDIRAEDEDYIKKNLYNLFIRDIIREALAGFPEWYKEVLDNG